MISQSLYADQERIEQQYKVVEDIFLSGITDAAEGVFPQSAELPYLQGFAQGMRDYPRRKVVLPIIDSDSKEYPLFCAQCSHFSKDKCGIKGVERRSTSYACDQVLIDCVF